MDACCGVGGNTLEFAQKADMVVAVDINEQRAKYTQYNCKEFKLENKVDIIRCHADP